VCPGMPDLQPITKALLAAWAFVAGASLGSFVNVVVARAPAGQSVVRPRSRCPRCLVPIAWFDNIPIASWVALRGRCRFCRTPISFRYPAVELTAGVLALLALSRHGPTGEAAVEVIFVMTLLALALIDLDSWLLPSAITWPLLAGGIAFSALGLAPAGSWQQSLWGAAVGFAAFAAISGIGSLVFRREALGFGDVWLLAGLGAFQGLRAILPVVLLASLQGTVVGLALAAVGRLPTGEAGSVDGTEKVRPTDDEETWVPPRNAVPFGPFLVAGSLEWLYLSDFLARLVPSLEIFR
jgi:leader peptidase (prepilin peptidase)/N-methyltransferase